MHPAGYYLAQAYLTGLRHQTQRDALGHGTQRATTPGRHLLPALRPSAAGQVGRIAGCTEAKHPLIEQSRSSS